MWGDATEAILDVTIGRALTSALKNVDVKTVMGN